MKQMTSGLAAVAIAATPVVFAGCESLPGDEREQGAAIGGAGGAVAGAALYKENRLLGALVGGLLGAGGGYIVGTELDKRNDEADRAAREARQNPATPEDARGARTADLDNNGFVTMDELTAMKEAGLSSREIINRAEATDQVFDLSQGQEDELIRAGYERQTLQQLREVNRDVVERYARDNPEDTSDRVSNPR